MGHNPWGHKESDMTERLSTHACTLGTFEFVLFMSVFF